MRYNRSSIGLSPKQIRIPRDITMEDIHKYFGPVHNKNGYSYVFSEDLEVIAKVKGLWMIIHQKPFVPGSVCLSVQNYCPRAIFGTKYHIRQYYLCVIIKMSN